MNNVTTCPSCQRPLRIPESLIGQQVKCPACDRTFQAIVDEEAPRTEPEPEKARRDDYPDEAPRRRDPDERRERRRDEEDDRPRRREESADDRPSRRRRDEDEEEEDDRPRRRRRSEYEEHRGTLILIMGILAWTMFPIPCGPIAWFLGNADLREIRAGRMDPEGESSTQIGRILGMISTILVLLGIFFVCMLFAIIPVIVGVGAAAR